MKINVEIVEGLPEDEIILQCSQLSTLVEKIVQEYSKLPMMLLLGEDEEYYYPVDDILFFETEGDLVYAHTVTDAFRIKYRLYELENMLGFAFVRASKSAILNIRHVFSVDRHLTSSSLVQFHNSHKQVYVSRLYYKNLHNSLKERCLYEKK